jgi:Putative cyclase
MVMSLLRPTSRRAEADRSYIASAGNRRHYTTAGKRYGQDDYVTAGCGMGYEATLYPLERGVRLTGTDGWSWDVPFAYTKENI